MTQLKARVANVERSYEALKQKCQQLEGERSRLEENNIKLSEEATR